MTDFFTNISKKSMLYKSMKDSIWVFLENVVAVLLQRNIAISNKRFRELLTYFSQCMILYKGNLSYNCLGRFIITLGIKGNFLSFSFSPLILFFVFVHLSEVLIVTTKTGHRVILFKAPLLYANKSYIKDYIMFLSLTLLSIF